MKRNIFFLLVLAFMVPCATVAQGVLINGPKPAPRTPPHNKPPKETTVIPQHKSFLSIDGSSENRTRTYLAMGARETFEVSSSSNDFDVRDVPEWCSIIEMSQTSFKLVVSENEKQEERFAVIKVAADGKEIGIAITQEKGRGPYATVEAVTQTHNILNGYSKYMKINVDFDVSGMKDQQVHTYAVFYMADNTTKLIGRDGEWVSTKITSDVPYDYNSASVTLYIKYFSLNLPEGWSGPLSFDILIYDSSNNLLGYKKNIGFYYPQ